MNDYDFDSSSKGGNVSKKHTDLTIHVNMRENLNVKKGTRDILSHNNFHFIEFDLCKKKS